MRVINYVPNSVVNGFLGQLKEHLIEGDVSRQELLQFIDDFQAAIFNPDNYSEREEVQISNDKN